MMSFLSFRQSTAPVLVSYVSRQDPGSCLSPESVTDPRFSLSLESVTDPGSSSSPEAVTDPGSSPPPELVTDPGSDYSSDPSPFFFRLDIRMEHVT